MSQALLLLFISMVVGVIETQGHQKLQRTLPTDAEGHFDNDTTTAYTPHGDSVSNWKKIMSSKRRILFGYISKEGEQPYQGILEITYPNKFTSCGCSLLSRTRILTAAHCCINCLDVDVILGRNQVTSGTTIRHAQFIPHEHFDNSKKINNIAMVKIPPVTFSRTIQPIALPSREELMNDWANDLGILSGFGRIEGNQESDVQRYAYVIILNNGLCNQLVPHFGDYNLCSMGPGGACIGDSGGPLSVVSNNRTVLVGIVSYGRVDRKKHACSVQKPVVYTRVTSYIHWIKSLM